MAYAFQFVERLLQRQLALVTLAAAVLVGLSAVPALAQCGLACDGHCGETVTCGTIEGGNQTVQCPACATPTPTPAPTACMPSGCNGQCGTVSDGCGNLISCGSCGGGGGSLTCGQACQNNCGQTVTCGTVNGGVQTVYCGDCATPTPVPTACLPTGCNGRCGMLDDGCGNPMSCGSCGPTPTPMPSLPTCGSANGPVIGAHVTTGGPYKGTVKVPLQFHLQGCLGAADSASFAWDFGDGSTATGVAPTHTYAKSGAYLVTISVTVNGFTYPLTTIATIQGTSGASAANGQLPCEVIHDCQFTFDFRFDKTNQRFFATADLDIFNAEVLGDSPSIAMYGNLHFEPDDFFKFPRDIPVPFKSSNGSQSFSYDFNEVNEFFLPQAGTYTLTMTVDYAYFIGSESFSDSGTVSGSDHGPIDPSLPPPPPSTGTCPVSADAAGGARLQGSTLTTNGATATSSASLGLRITVTPSSKFIDGTDLQLKAATDCKANFKWQLTYFPQGAPQPVPGYDSGDLDGDALYDLNGDQIGTVLDFPPSQDFNEWYHLSSDKACTTNYADLTVQAMSHARYVAAINVLGDNDRVVATKEQNLAAQVPWGFDPTQSIKLFAGSINPDNLTFVPAITYPPTFGYSVMFRTSGNTPGGIGMFDRQLTIGSGEVALQRKTDYAPGLTASRSQFAAKTIAHEQAHQDFNRDQLGPLLFPRRATDKCVPHLRDGNGVCKSMEYYLNTNCSNCTSGPAPMKDVTNAVKAALRPFVSAGETEFTKAQDFTAASGAPWHPTWVRCSEDWAYSTSDPLAPGFLYQKCDRYPADGSPDDLHSSCALEFTKY